MITLILHATSDRIIFFSKDSISPTQSPYSWISYTDLEIPEGMTLQNCWNWRFRENRFIHANDVSPDERGLTKDQSRLKRNKIELKNQLASKVDLVAKNHLPSTSLSGALRAEKLKSAEEYHATGKASDLLKAIAAETKIPLGTIATDIMMADSIARDRFIALESTRIRIKNKIEEAKTDQDLEVLRREIWSIK